MQKRLLVNTKPKHISVLRLAPGKPDEAPEVTINRSFIPEDFFKEKTGDEEELNKPVDEYIL